MLAATWVNKSNSAKKVDKNTYDISYPLLCNSSEIRLLWQIERVQERIREEVSVSYTHLTLPTSDLV